MYKTEEKNVRTFRQGYEELYQLGYQTADLMVTDLTKFSEFGIDQSRIDNLNELLTNFKKRSYDDVLLLKQQVATDSKNEKADEIRAILFKLEVKLRTDYGKKHPVYERLDISSISTLTESALVFKAGIVAYLANDTFASTLKFVISPEVITELTQKSLELAELIKLQKTATTARTFATQLRTELANNLFNEISKIRYIGKQMWVHSDYIKSKAYQMPKLNSGTGNKGSATEDDESFIINETLINDEPEVLANS